MTENRILIFFLLAGTFWLQACADDISPDPVGDLESIAYDPQPYEVPVPQGFPPLTVPADNPMTVDGVQLGRFLFYDPILSKDSTMSCFSCHLPQGGFTDNLSVSFGVEGLPGKRSAMSLENVAFYNNGLFWDGRAHTLEEQALKPVEDPLELNVPWEIVEARLRRHPDYPAMFRKAFGISDSGEITRDLAAKAIAQFERILVSSGTSKFDRKFLAKEIGIDFSEAEYNGFDMFFDIEGSPLPDAQCFHCHNTPLFTTNEYFNNGLQEAATLDDFPDPGRGAITGKEDRQRQNAGAQLAQRHADGALYARRPLCHDRGGAGLLQPGHPFCRQPGRKSAASSRTDRTNEIRSHRVFENHDRYHFRSKPGIQ